MSRIFFVGAEYFLPLQRTERTRVRRNGSSMHILMAGSKKIQHIYHPSHFNLCTNFICSMKLFNAQQIHLWDAYTMEHEPLSSIELMERAARTCTDFICDNSLHHHALKIFCGKGNNGGDGLAIARQLIELGIYPSVYILEFGAKGTDDFQTNLQRLHELSTDIHFVQAENFFPFIAQDDVVIDALFGSGLNRPLENLSAALVKHINESKAIIVSVDVPSGMFIDKSCKGNAVIHASHTLTFQSLKLCFLAAENASFFGEVHAMDINLDPGFAEATDAVYEMLTKEKVASLRKQRNAFTHKGNFGHALLAAGSTGKMGAAVLAARACLRSGAGLVTVNATADTHAIIHTAIPEAMCMRRDEAIEWQKFSGIGIGPGIGTDATAKQLLENIVANYHKPMLLDADALNILSVSKHLLPAVAEGSVLTPHPKEFARLFGETENEFDRWQLALNISTQYNLVIVVKGHHTLIAYKSKGWFNTTGNAGMAKGGSGDVLSGMITALLAQQYHSLDAAKLGVYLHGLAADIALENQSLESLLATDIIHSIGQAFKMLD